MFAGCTVNNTCSSDLNITNDNTVPSAVPILGQYNILELIEKL
jgi:hypothetical protein